MQWTGQTQRQRASRFEPLQGQSVPRHYIVGAPARVAVAGSPTRAIKFFPLIYSLLFFLSGFAGLLYQIVWLRLAFSYFGIITPVLSAVVSVFMLGLGVGSQFAGF